MIDELSSELMDFMQALYPEDVERLLGYDLSDIEHARLTLKLVIRVAEDGLPNMAEPQREAMTYLFERLNDVADGDEDAFGFKEASGSQPKKHYRAVIADVIDGLVESGVDKNKARRIVAKISNAETEQIREASRRRKPR